MYGYVAVSYRFQEVPEIGVKENATVETVTASRAYVLITPAKDEEASIGETIASVIGQSVLALQWVIVSDASTDRTEEIVRLAAAQNPWIRLVCLRSHQRRSFASVVHATEAGVKALTVDNYHYIGLLDADIRLEPTYFERVIERFESSPRLGLAGGMVLDVGESKNGPPRNCLDVPGAAQFFRRECFEQLGGLLAIPDGGWDALTCARARMLGYETNLFTDLVIDHLKRRNTGEGGVLAGKWQLGVRDHALGYHPVFEFFKCMDRVLDPPMIVGTAVWLAGYCLAVLRGRKRSVPDDLMRYMRSEQMERLKRAFRWKVGEAGTCSGYPASRSRTKAR